MLGLAISAMASHLSLWRCYFDNFIAYKLGLFDEVDSFQGDFAQQILNAYLCNCLESLHSNDASHKMAELHCYFNIHQLSLAKTATMLRPLSRMEKVRTKCTPRHTINRLS